MSWNGHPRVRFSLQQPTGTAGYTEVVAAVPGQLRPAGGAETLKFGGAVSIGQCVATVRFRTDIRADWRLVSNDGRTFQIASYADPDGRRHWLQIYCQELQ